MTVTAGVDLDAIRSAAERHGVAELALFGAVVTGDFGAGSDIDFLVDFLPDRPDPFEDFCALRDDLRAIVKPHVGVLPGPVPWKHV